MRKGCEIVKELIAIAKQMAFLPNIEGNFPLHIAIHNQQCFGMIHEIFHACPEVGGTQDKESRLLPFMLAAVGDWENGID